MAVADARDTASNGPAGGGIRSRLDGVRFGRLLVGVAMIALSSGYLSVALSMSAGTAQHPGPAVFPTGVGTLGVLSGLLIVGESLFGRAPLEPLTWPKPAGFKKMGIFLGATVLYVILLPILGQYVAGALYLSGMLAYLGRKRWWVAGLIGTAVAVAIGYVFAELLGVNLPSGIW